MLAGGAMALSSVSVVGNALLLGRWKPRTLSAGARCGALKLAAGRAENGADPPLEHAVPALSSDHFPAGASCNSRNSPRSSIASAVGQPLPFNVRNADHTLLLARGQVVDTFDQMEALFTRGALVDMAELRSPEDSIRQAPPEQLPKLWGQCMDRVGQTLQSCTQEGFSQALDEVTGPVQALIERDSDLAIFQVLRQDGNAHTQYGVTHSIHAAITAFLVAQRLGWDEASVQKVFKVALTMNLSMLELQGQLAAQTTPVTPEQREAILSHPQRSVEMLELSGITDTRLARRRGRTTTSRPTAAATRPASARSTTWPRWCAAPTSTPPSSARAPRATPWPPTVPAARCSCTTRATR